MGGGGGGGLSVGLHGDGKILLLEEERAEETRKLLCDRCTVLL
jgi:hypothetical protein